MTFFERPFSAVATAIFLLWLASPTAGAEKAIRLDAAFGEAPAKIQVAQGVAQGYGVPPADVGDPSDAPYGRAQQDSAGLTIRIDRLENHMRQLNGQIEQLQFENRKLTEQLKKFQEDVDFRFQDAGGHGANPAAAPKPLQKRTESLDAPLESATQAPRTAVPTTTPTRSGRRGDAFDPAEDPNALGAPRPLGSPAATPPNASAAGGATARGSINRAAAGLDQNDPDAPLDLSSSRLRGGQVAATPAMGGRPAPGNAPLAAAPGAVTAGGTVIAGATVNPQKEEFDVALGYYRQKEYENAEKSFAAFLQKNPKSKMASDATYYLGESFFQRGRQREAAEQYLKISTQYANAPRAPEALLRLGQSLYALGAKEQACATFGEIGRKYPNASASIKAGAEREAKRAQC